MRKFNLQELQVYVTDVGPVDDETWSRAAQMFMDGIVQRSAELYGAHPAGPVMYLGQTVPDPGLPPVHTFSTQVKIKNSEAEAEAV